MPNHINDHNFKPMIFTCSNKPIVQQLLKKCLKYSVKHVVISPGSRNAPLTISFTNNSLFTCYSIPDERSAAFYALGMAKILNEPVAIICTSGTAVLNYAPALAEAYYQEIPLIAITADRPPEWIDQEDGQTIRQPNIYNNFINYCASLPLGNNEEELSLAKKEIEKAFSKALANKKGPVQINTPFEEPLYELEEINLQTEIARNNEFIDDDINFDELIQVWNSSEKILIIAGTMQPDEKLNRIISNLIENKNAVVIAPSYSNLQHEKIIGIPEIIFNTLSKNAKQKLKPDLLISIGGSIVSKATKLFLREFKPDRHFDIDFNEHRVDTYLSLTDKIISSYSKALNYVNLKGQVKSQEYLKSILNIQEEKLKKSSSLIQTFENSDIKIYKDILESVDRKIDLHFSNSTPIRYSELFLKNNKINYFSNRGTSGIDGNTSIAGGAAIVSNNQTVLITGDISFGYDSNAFWNKHVPYNLKVVVINNGGGNIFRIISGPSNSNSLEFFETPSTKSTEHFCKTYSIDYIRINAEQNIEQKFKELLDSKSCTVLEIFTDGKASAESYKELFRKLRK